MFLHQLKFKNDIIPNYYMNEKGYIFSEKSNKILNPYPNKEGKPVVALIFKNRKVMLRLDYLIISSLGRYREDIIHLIHIDDNDMNCNPENLLVVKKSDIEEKYKTMYHVDKLEDICEEWKIYTNNPIFEVSNFGSIRLTSSKEEIKTHDSHGYRMFSIKGNYYLVHRLVAESFVENPRPEEFTYVNHIDGIKSNNIFYNLEWCNISMNADHAYLTGLNKKYDADIIKNICYLLSQGLPHVEISKITGVNRKLISDIFRGRRHKDISKEYEFIKSVPLSELYNQEVVIALMNSGHKPKEISKLLKIDYNQSFISFYERLRRKYR